MPGTLQTDGGAGLTGEKSAAAKLDYTLSWALEEGDKITGAAWTAAPAGLTISDESHTDTTTTAWIAGGDPGRWYTVQATATTDRGRTYSQAFRLFVSYALTLGAGIQSIFPDLAAAVASLRRDRLISVAQTYMPDVQIRDEYLLERILSAERQLERALRLFLIPHEIRPEGTPQEELDALAAAGEKVVIEPGYDYDPEMFRGDSWGLIELRQRPIVKIHRLVFAYPSLNDRVWDVPLSWVRPDRKYGRINLVPVQGTVTLPLNAWMLSVVGGGRRVPLMLQVSYRAGLDPSAPEILDVQDLVKKMAVRDILEGQFLPASSSASADGLSESISYDPEKYNEAIEDRVAQLRDGFHGIRVAVF